MGTIYDHTCSGDARRLTVCDFTDFMASQGAKPPLFRNEYDFDTACHVQGSSYTRVWHHDETTVIYHSTRTPQWISGREPPILYNHVDKVLAEGPGERISALEKALDEFCLDRKIPVPHRDASLVTSRRP